MPILWGTPEYRFRVPKGGRRTGQLQEIVIDVTLSAPAFDEPSKAMKKVLGDVTRNYVLNSGKILDFGAGKLRNTIYLLKRGFYVGAVEFAKVPTHSDQARKAYAKIERFEKFGPLVYPDQFLASKRKFSLAILINILNIMPVAAERSIVLQQCHKKLVRGGYLLWYSQYGDRDYKKRCTDDVRLGDGWYIGKSRRVKTFYREFSAAEMDAMMLANGYEFARSYDVTHNQVRLYRKTDVNPLAKIISQKDLKRAIPLDRTIELPKKVVPKTVRRGPGVAEVRPDPPELSPLSTLMTALSKVPLGRAHASKYHRLVQSILSQLFVPTRLRKITFEQEIFDGKKRIDLHARPSEEGFFANLRVQHGIHVPYVSIECKNYTTDIGNPEFDQLKGRFTKVKGQFGMIICRRIQDRADIVQHCKNALEADHYIIVLEDEDLHSLLEFRMKEQYAEMDELLEEKLDEVLL